MEERKSERVENVHVAATRSYQIVTPKLTACAPHQITVWPSGNYNLADWLSVA